MKDFVAYVLGANLGSLLYGDVSVMIVARAVVQVYLGVIVLF